MLESGLLVVVFIMGAAVGILAYDLQQRKVDRTALQTTKDELAEAAKKLSELHNGTITELKHLGDRINTHEYILKSKKAETEGMAGKRF